MSTGIQFELRRRERKRNEIWSVQYNIHTGQIIGIEPGSSTATDRLTLSFAKVRPILEGTKNQANFRVGFNEAIGALDLIDVRAAKPVITKKKQRSHGWLTIGEYQGDIDSDLRALLFNENGILRVEASACGRAVLKKHCRVKIPQKLFRFLSQTLKILINCWVSQRSN